MLAMEDAKNCCTSGGRRRERFPNFLIFPINAFLWNLPCLSHDLISRSVGPRVVHKENFVMFLGYDVLNLQDTYLKLVETLQTEIDYIQTDSKGNIWYLLVAAWQESTKSLPRSYRQASFSPRNEAEGWINHRNVPRKEHCSTKQMFHKAPCALRRVIWPSNKSRGG